MQLGLLTKRLQMIQVQGRMLYVKLHWEIQREANLENYFLLISPVQKELRIVKVTIGKED
jgi:hypothetical protein